MNGINATTDVIDASAATGALTVAAAQRTADVKTIKGGTGNDSIAMEATGDVSEGNLGTDTLVVDYTAVMGGIAVDLSSATDQITSMEGAANAATQTGFENVDLRAYDNFGSTVTGSAVANVITGTAGNDNISAGKGDDTIQVAVATSADTDIMDGGAGTDALTILAAGTTTLATDDNLINVETINLANGTNTLVANGQSDGFTINGGTGADTITGSTGADIIDVKNDSATDNVVFLTKAPGATGIDDIKNFTTAEDVIQLTKAGNFALDTTDADVADANEYVEVAGAAGDLSGSLHTSNDVIVLTHSAGFGGTDEVLTSIDGVAGADAMVVFFDSDTSLVTMAYDNDINDATEAVIIATFSDIANTGIAAAFGNADFVTI